MPKLKELVCDQIDEQIFMQDGARPHTSDFSLMNLSENFPGRIISDRLDKFWPPSSPDLIPCDSSLGPNTQYKILKTVNKYNNNASI